MEGLSLDVRAQRPHTAAQCHPPVESTAPCAAAVRCDTCPALQGIADGMVQDDIEDLEDEEEDEGLLADGSPRSLVHSKSDDGYVE